MLAICLALATLTNGLVEHLRNSRGSQQLIEDASLQSQKAIVEIYYETLCPSSLDLLNGSFRKAWQNKELRERMDVRLYPFGNARMLSKKEVSEDFKVEHPQAKYPVIDCQHGMEECLGNQIQACATKELDMSKSVDLVLCMASQGASVEIESLSRDCATKLDISMNGLAECITSAHGHKLMTELGKKSLDPELHRSYVPFVVVNGKHEQAADENDFLGPVCSAIGIPKPALCEASASVAVNGQISLAHHTTNRSSFCYNSIAETAKRLSA